MAKVKAEEYLELVKRSELVDTERLTQAISELEQPIGDSGIVGSTLIKAGLLTEWQNEKLLAGRYKGFFLGKYKILDHLGTGGMSSVYLAEHKLMRHRVAIKVLPKNLVQQSSYLERFHQEARAAALLDHPNMVRAYDVDNDRDTHFLVMEYVEGTDVKELVAQGGPLPYRTAAEYTRQAADGLSYAHSKGLVHRDVKPANLLVDKTGTVKILDLGLVRFSDDVKGSLTVAYDENMIGTVDYLAPEQAMNSHKADARADVYSLGCTLYFMLTGTPPFPEGTIPQRVMLHQTADPPSIRKVRADAPEGLLRICTRMMAKTPENRYQSAADVARLLTDWLSGSSGSDVLAGNSGIVRRTSPGASGLRSMTPPTRPPVEDEDLGLAPLDDDPVPKTGSGSGKTAAAAAAAAKKSGSGLQAAQKPGSGTQAAKKSGSGVQAGKPGSGTHAGRPSGSKAPDGGSSDLGLAPFEGETPTKPPSGSGSGKRTAQTATATAARTAPVAAQVRPQTAPGKMADELDDLLGSASGPTSSQPPSWSSSGPVYYSGSPSGSIWRLIGVGVLLGLVLIALGFGAWALMSH